MEFLEHARKFFENCPRYFSYFNRIELKSDNNRSENARDDKFSVIAYKLQIIWKRKSRTRGKVCSSEIFLAAAQGFAFSRFR